MTTTPELHELARDPQAFDTAMAMLSDRMGDRMRAVAHLTAKLHDLAGDRKAYRNTRVPVWGLSDLEVEREAQRKAAHGDLAAANILGQRASEQAMLDAINFELANMNAVYLRAGNRWTRFYPSVTKSQPHIHRTLSCSTLYPTTVMRWAPELSGKTDEQAVADLDEALCSVCFKDAPVALREYVSRKSQDAQDERQAEKDARATAKAAKQLTEDEQREMGRDRHGDRVTTVAKLKEIVRDAVEVEVEIAFWATHSPAGWDTESLARRRSNLARDLPIAQERSRKAQDILRAREAAHEGWGAGAADIARMQDSKRKSATREWNRR